MTSRDFFLNAIHIDNAYGAWLLGRPTVEAIIEEAKHRVELIFGFDRATYVFEPERRQVPLRNGSYEVIPQWRHMAWINGPVLNDDKDFDGSLLVLIWFADSPDLDWPTRLEGIVWEEHAKNWAF